MRKNRRHAAAIAASLLFIAALTLYPTSSAASIPVSCLLCGERGVADAVLNVALFVPLGAALAYAGLGLLRAVPLGFAVTVAVELAQLFIPGRDSSVGDVVTNTLGTALGVVLWHRGPALLAGVRRRAGALAVAIPLLTVLALALGAVLLRPALPPGRYYPTWQAGPAHPVWTPGRVTAAQIGPSSLQRRRVSGDSVRALWAAGAPLEVSAVGVPWTAGPQPMIGLYDSYARELVLLGIVGGDEVLRVRTVGAVLRLDQPDASLAGAWRPAAAAAGHGRVPVTLRAWRAGGGYCLTLDGRGACGLGWGLARSWAVLLYPDGLAPGVLAALDALWICALLLPSGFALRRRGAPFVVLLFAALLAALPRATGLLPTPPGVYGAALVGLTAGAGLRRSLARLLADAGAGAGSRTRARASTATQRSIRA